MKRYPAIATLEFRDITVGMHATDALLKKAPISLLKCGVISQGRYLSLIAGSTASVQESYEEGLFWGKDGVIDHVFLPDVADPLYEAVFGHRAACQGGAIGIIETQTSSCNILATERMLKGTPVTLVELRIADSLLHGKGVSIVSGELYDVEAAVEMAVDFLAAKQRPVLHKVITQTHEALAAQIEWNTSFGDAASTNLHGELP